MDALLSVRYNCWRRILETAVESECNRDRERERQGLGERFGMNGCLMCLVRDWKKLFYAALLSRVSHLSIILLGRASPSERNVVPMIAILYITTRRLMLYNGVNEKGLGSKVATQSRLWDM